MPFDMHSISLQHSESRPRERQSQALRKPRLHAGEDYRCSDRGKKAERIMPSGLGKNKVVTPSAIIPAKARLIIGKVVAPLPLVCLK